MKKISSKTDKKIYISETLRAMANPLAYYWNIEMQSTIQQAAVPVFNVSVLVAAKCLDVHVKKSKNIESKIVPKYPKKKNIFIRNLMKKIESKSFEI